ncbi:inhibitor of nuclear factor kappa-B kinase-interacting protein isoform 2-T2 [Pholidichthys leucotaenia]
MPTEVKQRRKTQGLKEVSEESAPNCKDETQKAETERRDSTGASKASGVDIKNVVCLMSLASCAALTWLVLQQNERVSKIEENYRYLQGKTSSLLDKEEEIIEVSKKCESIQLMLEGLGGHWGAQQAERKGLEQDVGRLKEWASGLTEKRAQLQSSLTSLSDAVGKIEERTSAISKDFVNKVSSVRTDIRRMDGLHSELESLLAQVGELEEKTNQVERSMVKRIGDLLASSIDRVSNLRAASERNAQAIDQLRRGISELISSDKEISERLRELESGRARLIRTVTFASDLKPKVAAIRRDFGAFEPQLSDLTLRIGRLAEDLTKREQDISELRQTLINLTAVEGELSATSKQVSDIADLSDIKEMHIPA